jgi:uncharacterized protein YjdB
MSRKVNRLLSMFVTFFVICVSFLTPLPNYAAQAAGNWANDPNNGDWSKPYAVKYDTAEADLMVRVGDIDNLGKGWPNNYNPFSGWSTDAPYPSVTHEPSDPAGTDQLMVISSFTYPSLKGVNNPDAVADGYTRSNNYKMGANPVVPVNVTFDTRNTPIEGAILQMYINDYQPMKYPGRVKYTAEIDGVRAPFLENIINNLNQHGPIGKLISVQIPREYLSLMRDGNLSIYLDDKTTSNPYGDGAAIDFVKLLINLGEYQHTGTISGIVRESGSQGKVIAGATVSAAGIVTATTDANGKYELKDVPAGLVTVQATKDGYIPQTQIIDDLEAGQNKTLNFHLSPQPSNNAYLSNLTVSSGTLLPLEPVFDKLITDYTVRLNENASSVSLTPTLEDSRATLTVNGVTHSSGIAKTIPIQPGTTSVTIQVTAQDGKTEQMYRVTIQTPKTAIELSRSLSKSAIKLGETTEVSYTLTPDPIRAEWLAGENVTEVTGIRPFFLLNQAFQLDQLYDLDDELDKLDGKGNDNNGGLALGGEGKNNFNEKMKNGYSGKVSLNQKLETEPSAKQSDIVSGVSELVRDGVKEITVPVVNGSQLTGDLKGRDSIRVDGFATFTPLLQNQRVKLRYKGTTTSPSTYTVSNLMFSERLPSQVEVVGISPQWSHQVVADTVTVPLPDITYRKNGDVYTADPIHFTITLKPAQIGTYLLHDARITYVEDGIFSITKFFNNLTLQVESAVPPVTSLQVLPDQASIRVGETLALQVRITPENADQSVTWSTSNGTVASVSQNGIVTGMQAGTAVITVKTRDGRFTDSSEITVIDPRIEYRLYYDSNKTEEVSDYQAWLGRNVWVELIFPPGFSPTYTLDGVEKTYTGMFEISKEGITQLGFAESSSGIVVKTIRIDKTPPVRPTITGEVLPEMKMIGNITVSAEDAGAGVNYIEYWTSSSTTPVRYSGPFQSPVLDVEHHQYSFTVYAKAYDHTGKASEVAERVFTLDVLPPVIEIPREGFIKQHDGTHGKIDLEVTVTDSGTGVDDTKVTYTIFRVDLSGKPIKQVANGNLVNSGGSSYTASNVTFDDEQDNIPGVYKVLIIAKDKVGNQTIETQLNTDYYMISPGYTLSHLPVALDSLNSKQLMRTKSMNGKDITYSNAPIKIKLMQEGGSYFKIHEGAWDQNDDVSDQIKLFKLWSTYKELFGSLKNFDLKVAKVEYKIKELDKNNLSVLKEYNWTPLKEAGLVIMKDGIYEVSFRITDNYRMWGANPVSNTPPELVQYIQIDSKLKRF